MDLLLGRPPREVGFGPPSQGRPSWVAFSMEGLFRDGSHWFRLKGNILLGHLQVSGSGRGSLEQQFGEGFSAYEAHPAWLLVWSL